MGQIKGKEIAVGDADIERKSLPTKNEENGICYFDLLPVEMVVDILNCLDWKSLVIVSRVCKLWYFECKREQVWQRMCNKMLSQDILEDVFVKLEKEKKSWLWILRSKLIEFKEDGEKKEVGFVVYKNGDRYEGEWKNNKREGYGALKTSVDSYIGEFSNNQREGNGTCTSKNGSKYEGQWKKDLRHGKGKYIWSNGDVYEGEFKSHSREGFGVYRWPSNDRYEGSFKNNAKHGTGCFYFANGDKFEGEYIQGKRNGKGVYTWPHGDVFYGEYKDDVRNGLGEYRYAYGGTYSGHYAKDKRHGKGTFVWPDGDKYEGTWECESRRGPGILFTKDGKIIHMIWNEADNANYAYFVPDKFPNAKNSK